MPKRIKLIRIPYFTYSPDKKQRFKCEHFPPLALGVLNSYLKDKSIILELDDLHVKVHYDNFYSDVVSEKIDYEAFFDKERIVAHIKNDGDQYLDDMVRRIMQKTSIDGYDFILLSSPAPIDISPVTSTVLIAKFIKEKSKAKIIVGGGGCPDLWQLGLEKKLIDFIVQGPGEIPLFNLIKELTGINTALNNANLTVADSRIIINSDYVAPILPNFDDLPIGKYRWFPDDFLSQQVPKNNLEKGILIIPFRFIIGCPFHCAFCCESGKEKQILFISPEKAVDCLEILKSRYDTEHFFFLSSTLNLNKNYINKFCDEIIRRRLKIYWTDCANFKYLDKDTLLKMRQAGAIRLIWGLETGSPRMLRYIDKGVTIEWAAEMLQASHEAGIWNGLEIICGLPHEKEEDVNQTINFLNKNSYYIDTVYLNPFYLDGSSLLFKYPSRYGIKNIKHIQRFATHKTEGPLDNYVFEFAFDEIDGLEWEDKLKQIVASFNKVQQNIRGGFWTNEMEAILFYLYSHLKDKKQIKEIYNSWADHKMKEVYSSI